jgi:hypothetical protein
MLVPDTKPGRRGIAYHRQGCDPYRVSGGDHWSEHYGKVCPGDARISQLINIIIPRVAAALAGHPEEDDVADTFIAWHSNVPYWCEPAGKRKLTPDNARWLKSTAKIPDLGDVAASFLNELPTYDEAGTAGGSTVSQLLAADDVPATPPASGAGG